MRKTILASLALVAAGFPAAGLAFAQAPAPPPAGLSEEDQHADPLPPGRYAAQVKKVCIDCHSGKPIVDMRFTKDDAERFYKNMVSSDLTTEQAQHIIEYLTTTLGA